MRLPYQPAATASSVAVTKPRPDISASAVRRRRKRSPAGTSRFGRDGRNLPIGRGSVKDGETLYGERCASCHGEFGEGKDRWPVLAGGAGTLKSHDPVKTIGSYWPYASTLMDYIRRAMPYGNAQSLTPDELYAVTAYVLSLNDVIKDENFVLSNENFATIKLSNETGFFDDDREVSEKRFWKGEPCMSNCLPGTAQITGRARVIDVTPESGKGPKVD
jgi:hypothetical protein